MNFNKKDAVADAVDSVLQQEALKGNQKKIDKNHNNKIDSDDFKILRGEKKVSEEIDINDASEDDISGQKKIKRKDDVGPGGNFKSSKVRFHAGPKNESLEEPLEKVLADTAPHSGVIKTVVATDLPDANRDRENKEKLKMKEGFTLKSFKEKYEEHSIIDQMINEVLSKDASAGDWIHDFVHSDNPKFAGKSKAMRKKMALAAYYAKQRNEETEQMEEGIVDTLKAAGKKALEKLGHGSDEDMRKDLQKKMGIPQTGKKPTSEEVEQIDELSKSTLGSYVKGAARDVGASRKLAADFKNQADKSRKPAAKAASTRLSDKFYDIAQKRHKGIGKAVERLTKEESEEISENSPFDWKKPREPEVKGGAGVKAGRAYGGAAQKSKPEQEEEPKKKVTESKRPEDDSVPFAPPYNTTSAPVTDKSGATHTPMSKAKHLARLAMQRVKKDLGKK